MLEIAPPQPDQVEMPGGVECTLAAEPELHLHRESVVVSAACGRGAIECYLAARYACRVIGVDNDMAQVTAARDRARAGGLGARVLFVLGDGHRLPFPDARADLLYCSGALTDYMPRALDEFARVLREGGRLLVIDLVLAEGDIPAAVERYWSVGVARVSTVEARSRELAAAGLEVVSAGYHHRPEWWEAYYAQREPSPAWKAERNRYLADQDCVGVGVWLARKV